MNRKPEIDEEIRNEIDANRQQSGALMREGKIRESTEVSIKGWNLIPEPKEKWDYYPQSMAVSFVTRFCMLKDVDNIKKWINQTYQMYGDPQRESQYVLMIEGSSMHELGRLDEAFKTFERLYTIHGREGFPGEQTKYLEFFLKTRAAREK